MSGLMGEYLRKLRITEILALNKFSKVQIEAEGGSVLDVSLTELRRLAVASRFEVVTAANTITADENGKTFYLDAAAGFASVLPAPALGLEFEFVVRTAPTSNGYTIGTNGGADIIKGLIQESETDTSDDGPTDQNADLVTFVANIAVAGDYVRLRSDGTSWFMEGMTAADGGVTTATS